MHAAYGSRSSPEARAVVALKQAGAAAMSAPGLESLAAPLHVQGFRFGNSRGGLEEAIRLGFHAAPATSDSHKEEALKMLQMVGVHAARPPLAGRSPGFPWVARSFCYIVAWPL
jgi:hypothetical protein